MRRDIAELQDAGVDIEITKQANRIYARLTEERSYSSVAITKRERFTLLAVRRVFDAFRDTPLLEDVLSVLAKLEQRMSEKGARRACCVWRAVCLHARPRDEVLRRQGRHPRRDPEWHHQPEARALPVRGSRDLARAQYAQ